jgi:hypothetical protein
MKFDFKKGKEEILEYLDMELDQASEYTLEYIKSVYNMEDIVQEVESFNHYKSDIMNRKKKIERSTTMRDIFNSLEGTPFEDDDEMIIDFFVNEQ